MSYQLPTIDMSTFSVGKSGQINLNTVQGKTAFDPSNESSLPHLRIFNDSGSALGITSDDGSISDYIPAGAWPVYELGQTTKLINFTVLAILPNPPIQLLMPTYYIPGEKVPDTPQLGNSPIGIGGTVQTSSVQTLSNEGGSVSSKIIDIGDVNFADLIDIFNDGHGSYAVDQAGVKHTVLLWSASGNPLVMGAVNDTIPFNGAVTIAQTLGVTGISTFTGNIVTNGGMNNNTFRDNTAGAIQMALSNVSPQVTINNNEAISGTLAINTVGTSINGTTSGTATLYQFLVGTFKLVLVVLSNFRNGSAGDQNISIPTPFTTTVMGWSSQSGPFHLNHSSTNNSVSSQTGWPGSAGSFGTAASSTVGSNSQNFFNAAATDQIGLFGSQSSAFTGTILMIGI